VTLDPFILKGAVIPEPVKPRLLNDDQRERPAVALFSLCLQPGEKFEECFGIAAEYGVFQQLPEAW
jgi:hypothetical protein